MTQTQRLLSMTTKTKTTVNKQALEYIQDIHGFVSQSAEDTIEFALQLYLACIKEERRGRRICSVDNDGDILRQLVLFDDDGTK